MNAILENIPFWKDGFALVETPYLGMEHQSAIAYGNEYKRGYLGGMIPPYMDWDYIIVHETGHEYWGNSISINDHAEMWIHESFTTYMEALFVECAYSYQDALIYMNSQLPFIENKEPILGPLNVNWQYWKSSDHYFKGAWMLHTLRHTINKDEIWFDLLKSLHESFKMSNVSTQQIIDFINTCTKRDYSAFFEQYLTYPALPVFQYQLNQKGKDLIVKYRWLVNVTSFDMPLLAGKKGGLQMLYPSTEWQEILLKDTSADNFYIPKELFLIEVEKLEFIRN